MYQDFDALNQIKDIQEYIRQYTWIGKQEPDCALLTKSPYISVEPTGTFNITSSSTAF